MDVLAIPGGPGYTALMEDDVLLWYLRSHVASGRYLYAIGSGVLLCGAAGILRGRRAAIDRASSDQVASFGALPAGEPVAVDGNLITAANAAASVPAAALLASQLGGASIRGLR